MITLDGTIHRPRIDSGLVKELARAHRWLRLLEIGESGSITKLAAAEKVDRSYLCRVHRLTLLAPEITEEFVDGRQQKKMMLAALNEALRRECDRRRVRRTDFAMTTSDAGYAPDELPASGRIRQPGAP